MIFSISNGSQDLNPLMILQNLVSGTQPVNPLEIIPTLISNGSQPVNPLEIIPTLIGGGSQPIGPLEVLTGVVEIMSLLRNGSMPSPRGAPVNTSTPGNSTAD